MVKYRQYIIKGDNKMTDEIQESSSAEGSVDANPAASQGKNDKPTSAFDAESLLKQVEGLIEKKVQSVKDRRFDEMDKRLGGTEAVLERVKDLIPAKEFTELKKDLEFEELKRRVYEGKPQTSTMAKVVGMLGLDANDVEVIAEITSKRWETSEAAELAAHRLKERKATKLQPSEASAASAQAAPPQHTPEGLKQNYIKDAKAARGNRIEMVNVQKRYQAQGLDTGQIDLAKELHI
jgi:hypothetical protein